MATFRVTYHTTGGPFSQEIDAADAAAAETAALAALKDSDLVRFTVKELNVALRSSQVAAVTVEEVRAASTVRRSGLLGSLKGD